MARAKVLQVITRLALRGVPRHVLELADALDRSRFDVEVLAGSSDPLEGSLWSEARERGIRTLYVADLQRAVHPLRDARALRSVHGLIERGGYDLVHTHISKAGIVGRAAARRAGVPVIVHTYHGSVAEVHGPSPLSWAFRLCERMAARWTDRLLAVSQAAVRTCLGNGIGRPEQYRVIHNGIDPEAFRPRPAARVPELPGRGPVIGTVGSLTREKGMDLLLAAASRLRPCRPDLRLCVVGDGVERQRLERQVRASGLQDTVFFAGAQADVRPWLASADVFALASRAEGLPGAMLEAMAMERPVVATRVGGIPEAAVDGVSGLLVPPEDPEALAVALERLLADAPLRERMGREGRQRVCAEFTVARMVERVAEEYERLLAETGSRR